jgi:hypothetical protein
VIQFSHCAGKVYNYTLQDVAGRIVTSDYFISHSKFDDLALNTEELKKGIYFVVITGGNNETYNTKFYKN